MTWFSRAAPRATDPRGGTAAREGGGADCTKRTRQGKQLHKGGRRNATGIRSCLRSKGEGRTTWKTCKGEVEGGAGTQLVRGAKEETLERTTALRERYNYALRKQEGGNRP